MFQSTPSGGKATCRAADLSVCVVVSIHAFRGEGDLAPCSGRRRRRVSIHAFRGEGDVCAILIHLNDQRFNPRLPGGRRPSAWSAETCAHVFQSTPSGGKATSNQYVPGCTGRFQSTPSGGKATNRGRTFFGYLSEFQSTPSGGKATWARAGRSPGARRVSIHAFRGEGDPTAPKRAQGCNHRFNPRLPGGRRPCTPAGDRGRQDVSIHAFRGEGDRTRRA